MKFRPFFSFVAFAAVFAVLIFDNRQVIAIAAGIATAAAFGACVMAIQTQVAAGVKHIDWGDIVPPFLLMWIGLHHLAKVLG
ncbi:hypothetical protein [Cupriavidus taiwanensis]|uniref:hypothetical protein n=1 Tax=Cupriavidus taiwanensis TaxID=164546 RepID=UPI0012FEDA93|nr:hypothetical protein [Cupriavidus taiwanensis]